MPESPVPIHLGDLARALKKLKPADEKTRIAIAVTLGMSWETSEQLKPVTKLKRAIPVKPVTIRSQPSFDPVPTSRAVLASSIEHTRVEDAAASIYVPPLPASAPEDETQSPPLEPLFFPRWTRNILTASLATHSEIGPLDVDRVVRTLAKGQALVTLPLLRSPTLSRGVQLLIDRSQAMTPFIKDQMRLHKEIVSVVGKERVMTARFVGDPGKGAGSGAADSWSDYQPPSPGVPVLLLSDLGIGRPLLNDERSGEAEWLKFARLVKRAKCPLLAFVPYAPERWPVSLRSEMTIIQWDRNITAMKVVSQLKRM